MDMYTLIFGFKTHYTYIHICFLFFRGILGMDNLIWIISLNKMHMHLGCMFYWLFSSYFLYPIFYYITREIHRDRFKGWQTSPLFMELHLWWIQTFNLFYSKLSLVRGPPFFKILFPHFEFTLKMYFEDS